MAEEMIFADPQQHLAVEQLLILSPAYATPGILAFCRMAKHSIMILT